MYSPSRYQTDVQHRRANVALDDGPAGWRTGGGTTAETLQLLYGVLGRKEHDESLKKTL